MAQEEKKKEKKERKYFEVWGSALSFLDFLKLVILVLLGLNVYLVILLKKTSDKPPIVIRVDRLGETQVIKSPRSEHGITAPEVINFTRIFLKYFTQYDNYTYENDFKETLQMSTFDYQKKADIYLSSNRIPEMIKQVQPKTSLNVSKIDITKDTPQNIFLKVKGYREMRSYNNPDFSKEVIFEAELILKKVERTLDHPYGLLVDNYLETVFKEK